MLFACVLAGGKGERFWPLSREDRPKQLTNLTGEGTMLRLTVERLLPVIPAKQVLVITSASLAGRVRRELDFLPEPNIIAEPVGRNSAPAIALAARWCLHQDPEATFLVAPSDHVIDGPEFLDALSEASAFVGENPVLATFGIRPTRPDTGYGYIEIGEPISGRLHRAVSFREKPDPDTARSFVDAGTFLWNSGMFVWKARVLSEAIRRHLADVSARVDRIEFDRKGIIPETSLVEFYEGCPSISIDYAVMEKADNVVVLDSSFGWCDVGSWAALGDVLPSDESGNVKTGTVQAVDVRDSILFSDGPPIAVVGVEGLVVVRVGEVTLVCRRDRAGDVRELVRRLRNSPEWRRYL